MDTSIWKFEVPIADRVVVSMPEGAKLLRIESLNNISLVLWALVDVRAALVARPLSLRGTGHRTNGLENIPFIGTVIMLGGSFVVHVWDGEPDAE